MKGLTQGWKLLGTYLAALSFFLPVTAGAADDIRLCGKAIIPSPAFERQALIDQTYADFVAGRPQAAKNRIADTFEQSLRVEDRAEQPAQIFLRYLRSPSNQSSLWAIASDDNLDNAIFFEQSAGPKALIPCRRDPIPTYAHDMAAIASYVGIATAAQQAPGMEKRWSAIKKQATDHEDLLRNGLPMWPWELWLNGKRLGKSDADPLFTTQVVFMRPSAGVEINTRSREAADLEASLLIEPIGFVRYMDDSHYSKWWGASVVVTSSTGDGMGYGALFRYGRYTAGLTLHKSEIEGEKNDVHLLLGVDFYDLIEKKRGDLPGIQEGLKKSFSDLLK